MPAFYSDEYEELLERQLTKSDIFLDDFVPDEYIRYRRGQRELYSPRQMQMKRIWRRRKTRYIVRLDGMAEWLQ